MKKLIFYFLFIIPFSVSYAQNGIIEIRGPLEVCANDDIVYYVVPLPVEDGGCQYFYEWEIVGGVFIGENNTNIASGQNKVGVKVEWDLDADRLLTVKATDKIAPASGEENFCYDDATWTKYEGNYIPDITGDASISAIPPNVSAVKLLDYDRTPLLVDRNTFCYDNYSIYMEVDNPQGYEVEKRLTLLEKNSDGETVNTEVIQDWSTATDILDVDFNFNSAYTKVDFVCETRFRDCPSTETLNVFSADFFPQFLIEQTEILRPECEGEGGEISFQVERGDLEFAVVNIINANDETVRMTIEVAADSGVLTLRNNPYEYFDVEENNEKEGTLKLLPDDYIITIESNEWTSADNNPSPCYYRGEFTIQEAPELNITNILTAANSNLACFENTTSLSLTAERQQPYGGTLNYKMEKETSSGEWESVRTENGESGQVKTFTGVSPGTYRVQVKYVNCGWDNTDHVLESETVTIGYQKITVTQELRSNELLNCSNSTNGSLTVKAKHDQGGDINYQLFKKDTNDDWTVEGGITSGTSGEEKVFDTLGIGTYKVGIIHSGCSTDENNNWVTSGAKGVEIVKSQINIDSALNADDDLLSCSNSTTNLKIKANNDLNGTLNYKLEEETSKDVWEEVRSKDQASGQVEFINVFPGTYRVLIKGDGCSWDNNNDVEISGSVTIGTSELSIQSDLSATQTNLTCSYSTTNLSIRASSTQGEDLNYKLEKKNNTNNWEQIGNVKTGSSGKTKTFLNEPSGTYRVLIKIDGCSWDDAVESVEVQINASDPIEVEGPSIPIKVTCFNGNGAYPFTVSGGPDQNYSFELQKKVNGSFKPMSGINFNFSDTDNSGNILDLENSETYRIEVTDGSCTGYSDEFYFDPNTQPTLSSSTSYPIPCKGDSIDIDITMNDAKGDLAEFSFSLGRNLTETDNYSTYNDFNYTKNSKSSLTLEKLPYGYYKLVGEDGNSCAFDTIYFELNEPDVALTINAYPDTLFTDTTGQVYHISKYGASDGVILFEAEGGEGNYIFDLFANGVGGNSFTGLKAKDVDGNPIEYYVSVEDELNCLEISDTFILTEPDSLIFTYELNNYISSANDTFNIKCYGGTDTIRVETEGGVYPHLVRLFNSNDDEQNRTLNSEEDTAVFSNLPQETYRIEVIDKYFDGVNVNLGTNIDTSDIELTEPLPLGVNANMTQPICYGDSTGSITIAPSGGVPFANGEYDIHIFDQEGNSILNETTDELSIVADSGIYYYTIFDAFECEFIAEDGYFTGLGNKIAVTELSPRLSVVKDTITYPPCTGDETASLSVSVSGGRSDDGSYILELYDNNDPPLYGPNQLIDSVSTIDSGYYTFQNLFAGDYTVTVYDDELCSEMIPITIEERGDSLDYLSVEPILSKCANSSDAQLKIISIGGDSPHSFSLNNTDFSPSDSITYSDDSTITYYHKTFTGLKGDSTYAIYLKDDNFYEGSFNNVCLIDTSQNIPKTPTLALSFEKTDIQCFGEENGDFTLSPSYGDIDNINDFTIKINGPNGVISHAQGYVNNLSAGRYEIEITLADTSACQTPLFDKIDIDQPEPLIVDIFSTTKYNCSTTEDITLNGEISGGLSTGKLLYAINSENSAEYDTLKTSTSEFRIRRQLEAGWNVFYLKSSPYNCIATDSFFVESEKPNLQILTNQAVSCFGKSDGEIKVTSNFEKLNFKLMKDEDTFSIDDSEADTVVFEGLEVGIYQLTGSSSSCLADTLEVIVNQPDSIIIQPVLVEKPSCNQANGIGTVNISGGTAPYEILWQTENGNILDSSSLKSGYYDIIVEDANNCSAIFKDFLVEELNDFTVSVQSFSNPTCGKDNGSILIQPIEGIPPYDFNWFKDGSKILKDNDSLTGLTEGSYTFSVTDAMGCVFEDSVELIGSAAINVNISEESPANCNTQNGSVALSVTGGNPPYTYIWSDSIPYAEGNYAEGLWGGKIYTVSVSDVNLCSIDYEFAIGNNGAPEVAVHNTNPKCGLANGSIEIEVLSENNASYEWRGFETTSSTLENIPSGIYFVTVTANDCPITKRIELTEDINNPITVNPININASCNDIGGEIDLNISGGSPPYAITWDDTPLNDSIRTGLSSGNYSFVVTDSVGCTASGDIYLDKEELPQLSLNSIGNAACGETNGYIQLDSLSNDYTFNWSHNDLLDNHLAENLSSGLYSVYAVNAAGCSTDTVSYYISSSNTDLRIQEVAVISASCNESTDGSLEVNAVNGVPPYQYKWDDEDQQTGNIAQGLRPGTYTVRVTDATNCSRVKSLTLGQVNPVYISNISKNTPSCPDAMDGSITITASGGKGNYSYEWSTGDTTSTISGLESGEYSVTVYDNFVCSDQARISITAPDTLSAEYFSEKPNCYTTADGQVEISISGGIPPYNVEWEDGSTLKRRFDLGAGNYEVFISDNNNCSIVKNINVPAKDSVSIDYEITSVSCNGGNDGSIRIKSITNANSPKVEWSNGQIGNTLRNVSAGFYEADVTDSYGCITSFEFEVGSPDPLQFVSDTITNVLCKNGFNGSIAFDVIGGSGNYNFNWDDGPRTKNRFNLTAGNYKVTVSDDLNCTIERQFSISEPDLLVVDYTASSVSCFGNADGFASIEIKGGVSPYQINWADRANDTVRNDLAAGTHDVLVTDANNCSKSIEVIIPNLNPIRINEVIQTIPSCYKGSDGELELDISGGVAPYSVSWSNGKTGASIDSISAGNYQVTITDDNNCQLTELISLGDGTPIYLTSLVTANPICYGEPTGMVEVVPNGGNPPFEVVWADGVTATRRDDLLAGSHAFDVVDSTGCSVSYEINLQDPPLEIIEGIPDEVFLCTGGVANLDAGEWNSYNWTADNGFTSNEREVSIEAEGNYNLTVTNQEGCEDNHQFTVTKDDNILTADFLLTTEAVVQDTVIIVDVSWRVPDSVRWINPDDPDFYLVSQTEEYQEVIFTRTGEFELNMKAKLDFCEANVSKTITVLSREEAARLSDEANKNISNDLHVSTSIYPNPNHGDFRIEMKGNKEYDHNSKIIDVNTGIEYYRFSGKKQMNYILNIGDNQLPDGVYLLMLEAEGKTITKRFIVK